MSVPDFTTIKVTKALRNRITAGAAEQRQTVQKFIEDILANYERQRRLDAVSTAMAASDESTLREGREELADWASVDADNP